MAVSSGTGKRHPAAGGAAGEQRSPKGSSGAGCDFKCKVD